MSSQPKFHARLSYGNLDHGSETHIKLAIPMSQAMPDFVFVVDTLVVCTTFSVALRRPAVQLMIECLDSENIQHSNNVNNWTRLANK